MSCDFLYSTDGIWLLSCSIYVISDMTDTWECKSSALSAASGAQTQVRRREPCSSDNRAGNDYVQPKGLAGARQKAFHQAGEGREVYEA